MSVPRMGPRKGGGRRSTVRGWSNGAAARHRAWLQSVDPDRLPTPHALAFTLTMKETPSDAVELHEMRRAWEKRMQRAGAVAGHWVVELQRRGTPHLHGAVWFSEAPSVHVRYAMISAWVAVCERKGITATPAAQFVTDVTNVGGWGRYCSKHSARSASHYQRSGLPDGWETSGRVWGHWGGPWNTREEVYGVDMDAWHQMRRLLRSWAIADARKERDPIRRKHRLAALKRSWKRCDDPALSRVLPVREWAPEATTRRMLDWLLDEGYVLTLPEGV